MNKSESKYFNTARKMNEALISLLETKDFQYITIKEICDKAEVNRSTFYLHYDNISELLNETIAYKLSALNEKFIDTEMIDSREIDTCPKEKLLFITPKYLIPYLEFVKENKAIFTVAVTQPSVIKVNETFNERYTKYFAPIMKRFGLSEEESRYKMSFYLNGMFAVIIDWIKKDCKDDIDFMAKLLRSCIYLEHE